MSDVYPSHALAPGGTTISVNIKNALHLLPLRDEGGTQIVFAGQETIDVAESLETIHDMLIPSGIALTKPYGTS